MDGDAEPPPEDVQATFCATLVDTWVRLGVRHAVISPGSRSTPMALAVTDRSEIAVHVVHDERSAAFVALGLGIDGTPALLLCTSGTAAANFYPAVVEAGLSEVPMIVLTADRPEELRGVGAPQTIDQIDLYGKHVRWSRDPGVADHGERTLWRELAGDAWAHAAVGPVQLNLAFREPLLGESGPLPDPSTEPVPVTTTSRVDPVPAGLACERGVVLAGGRSGVDPQDVASLHRATGWPILADPVSNMRDLDGVVTSADALLRVESFAGGHLPDVLIRVGRPAASKVLAQWTARATGSGALLVQVGGPGTIDPDHNVAAICSIDSVMEAAGSRGLTGWTARWLEADQRADAAVAATLAGFDELTEPAVARLVAEHLPIDAALTVASSMPVRDLEWFGGRRARAHSNRGANGIDGVVSTGLGRALAGEVSFVLVGDLAFVHDSNALIALAHRHTDLRIIVLDNDGGGIFSFLPQAAELPTERFEQLFGTPLTLDVVALATAYGLDARTVQAVDELVEHLAVPGPWVCCVPSDRRHNVAVHAALHAAVAAALADD
jgi:2-succinyl-5-enolpyruvyl-6-hydroxy-3-cyclohexene-1-carboxylate synthase